MVIFSRPLILTGSAVVGFSVGFLLLSEFKSDARRLVGGGVESVLAIVATSERTEVKADNLDQKSLFHPGCFGNVDLNCPAGFGSIVATPPENAIPTLEKAADFNSTSRFVEWGENVVRIDILSQSTTTIVGENRKSQDSRRLSVCTGLRISDDYIVSAGHCFAGASLDDRGDDLSHEIGVIFGYMNHMTTAEWRPAELCGSAYDSGIDLALLSVTSCSADRVTGISAVSDAVEGQELLILHHPNGYPLRLSRINCRLLSSGLDQLPAYLLHSCGTLGGSSGAPIFDEYTGNLIAFHVGTDSSVDQPVQPAVSASLGLGALGINVSPVD